MRDVLVVAPHPDDEVIGAFGLLALARARRARVRVLVVTDGAASHPGSRRWPPARLAAERRRESRRAMRAMGQPPSRLAFLALPDGRLGEQEALLRRRLGRALSRAGPPDLIVGPVAEDAHADHRAVAAALAALRPRARLRLGYRVWPLGPAPGHRLRVPLDARTRAAKRRAVLSFRTQAGRITDAQTGMTMRPHHLRSFASPVERFRVLA